MCPPPTDRVIIEGQIASALSPEGTSATMSLPSLLQSAFPRRIDTSGLILPAGTVLASSFGPFTALVNQIPPRTYGLRWIEPRSRARFGPGTRYTDVHIALPYLIIIAVFHNGILTHLNECFFRTEPITSDGDSLNYPALLNCSRFNPQDGRPLAWICTQMLDLQPLAGKPVNEAIRIGFELLRHGLIETGFNESSEHHEGSSWYAESRKVDPRISSIEAWQKATDDDPFFVLDVPWLPTGLSVRQVVERIFTNQRATARSPATASDLARIIFNQVT
jgi:hypothetical protein